MKTLIIEAAGPRLRLQLTHPELSFASTDDGRHDQRLQPEIERLLASANMRYRDLESIAVAAGPGSFTGIRVALAFCQGLSRALGCPVKPLDSLALHALRHGPGEWHVVEDARLGEAYEACYRVSQTGLEILKAPSLTQTQHLVPQAQPLGSAWSLVNVAVPDEVPAEYCPSWNDYVETVEAVSAEHLEPVYLRDRVQWKKLSEQPRPLA